MQENAVKNIPNQNSKAENQEANFFFKTKNEIEKPKQLILIRNNFRENDFEKMGKLIEKNKNENNESLFIAKNKLDKIKLQVFRNGCLDKQKNYLLPIFRKTPILNCENEKENSEKINKLSFFENDFVPFKNEKTIFIENLRKQIKLKNDAENLQINPSLFEGRTFLRLIPKSNEIEASCLNAINILPPLQVKLEKLTETVEKNRRFSMNENLKAIYANLCTRELEINSENKNSKQNNIGLPFILAKNKSTERSVQKCKNVPIYRQSTSEIFNIRISKLLKEKNDWILKKEMLMESILYFRNQIGKISFEKKNLNVSKLVKITTLKKKSISKKLKDEINSEIRLNADGKYNNFAKVKSKNNSQNNQKIEYLRSRDLNSRNIESQIENLKKNKKMINKFLSSFLRNSKNKPSADPTKPVQRKTYHESELIKTSQFQTVLHQELFKIKEKLNSVSSSQSEIKSNFNKNNLSKESLVNSQMISSLNEKEANKIKGLNWINQKQNSNVSILNLNPKENSISEINVEKGSEKYFMEIKRISRIKLKGDEILINKRDIKLLSVDLNRNLEKKGTYKSMFTLNSNRQISISQNISEKIIKKLSEFSNPENCQKSEIVKSSFIENDVIENSPVSLKSILKTGQPLRISTLKSHFKSALYPNVRSGTSFITETYVPDKNRSESENQKRKLFYQKISIIIDNNQKNGQELFLKNNFGQNSRRAFISESKKITSIYKCSLSVDLNNEIPRTNSKNFNESDSKSLKKIGKSVFFKAVLQMQRQSKTIGFEKKKSHFEISTLDCLRKSQSLKPVLEKKQSLLKKNKTLNNKNFQKIDFRNQKKQSDKKEGQICFSLPKIMVKMNEEVDRQSQSEEYYRLVEEINILFQEYLDEKNEEIGDEEKRIRTKVLLIKIPEENSVLRKTSVEELISKVSKLINSENESKPDWRNEYFQTSISGKKQRFDESNDFLNEMSNAQNKVSDFERKFDIGNSSGFVKSEEIQIENMGVQIICKLKKLSRLSKKSNGSLLTDNFGHDFLGIRNSGKKKLVKSIAENEMNESIAYK